MQRANVLGVFALTALGFLGATGCSTDATSNDGQTTTTNGTTNTETETTTDSSTTFDTLSTSGTESESESETDTNDSTNDTWESSGSFYAVPYDYEPNLDCDPFAQDCPEGEKCVPYASTGGTWNANKCVPVLGDQVAGGPCSYSGTVDSTDDCDATSFCWHTEDVDGQLVGVCTEFCEGTADAPECDANKACMIANEGSIVLCLDTCDPLAQDCPDGMGCTWAGGFVCTFLADEPGGVCDYVADCPSGSLCVDDELVPDCAGASCCASWCSLSDPQCATPGTECTSFFPEGEAPPEYVDLGLCVVPA